jgi:hypothetical protein
MKLEDVNSELLDRLEEILSSYRGSSLVSLDLRARDGATATMQVEQRVRTCPELIAAIRETLGEQSIDMVM